MHTVNVHEAKTHLSALLKKVESGQEVVISRSGRPVARLVPWEAQRQRIAPPGSLAHTGSWILDDFDEPVDEVFESLGDHPDEGREGSA